MSWLDPFLSAYNAVRNNGTPVQTRQVIDFTGSATVTDDPNSTPPKTIVDIATPGGFSPPGSYALALESTGPGTADWRPRGPTLVPSGGSDIAQIAAAFAASNDIYLATGTFHIPSNTTIGGVGKRIHVQPGAMLRPGPGANILLGGDTPDVAPDQPWIDLTAGGTFTVADGGGGLTTIRPDWFVGCDRTGSADSSAAVQAAIDALPTLGGVVEFQAGYYRLSGITIAKNGVRLQGAQRFATTIMDNSATADLFTFAACGLFDVADLEIRRPSLSDVKTAGKTFNLNGVNTGNIRRLRITSPYQGIHVHGGSGGLRIENVKFLPGSTAANWAYGVAIEESAGIVLRDVDVNMGNNVTVLNGLLVIDGGCDTIVISDCGFGQVNTTITPWPTTGGTCVLVQNTNASFDPRWLHFTNVITEAVNGYGFDVSAANQASFVGCTVQTSLGGIRVTGGNDLRFFGGFVNQIQEHGVQLTGGERIFFNGVEVTACSRELTNTYSGFAIGGTAQDVHIEHAAIGDTETLGVVGYSMLYGIAVSVGSSDDDASHVLRHNVFGPLCTNEVFRGIYRAEYGTRFEAEGTTSPAGGTWAVGDVVHNLTPTNGGPAGWVCSVAGTPGTWVPWYVHAVAPTSAATANAPVIRDVSAGAAFAALTTTGITVSGLTASQAVVTNGSSVLASLAYTPAATASTISSRDANGDVAFHQGNFSAGIIVTGSTQLPSNGLLRVGAAGAAVLVWRRADNGIDVAGMVIDGSNNFIIGDSTGADGTTIIDGKVVRLRDPAQATAFQVNANKNLSFFSTGSFGGGQAVVSGANATTAPTSDPTGGGVYYWSGGALMHRGSSGTITTVAPS